MQNYLYIAWMKPIKIFLWLTIFLIVVGCKVDYDITMKPVDGGLKRTTTVRGSIGTFETDSLTNVYGEQKTIPDTKRRVGSKGVSVWNGVVNNEWDNGIGGLGSWIEIVSPLGSVKIFIETIGGDASVAENIEAILLAIEAAEATVQEHLAYILNDDPLLPKVQTLLRNRILPDTKDLALMVIGNSAYFQDEDTFDGVARDPNYDQIKFLASFLWQRGWITSDKAAMYTLPFHYEKFNTDFEAMIIIGRALGLDISKSEDAQKISMLVEKLAPLFSEEFALTLLKNMEESVTDNGGDFSRLHLTYDCFLRLILHDYKLVARIESETRPTTTNGQWDNQTNTVTFTLDSIPLSAGYFMPTVLWQAIWESPNTDYQKKIFGQKILLDELLSFNIAWHQATEDAKSEVNTFLTLKKLERSEGRFWSSKKIIGECISILLPIK